MKQILLYLLPLRKLSMLSVLILNEQQKKVVTQETKQIP